MPAWDLSTATAARVANQNVDRLRIANQDIWTLVADPLPESTVTNWINRTAVVIPESSGNAKSITIPATQEGSLLLAFTDTCSGATFADPWVRRLREWNITDLSLWTKTAEAGETTIPLTIQEANFSATAVIYELPQGTTLDAFVGATNGPFTGANPPLEIPAGKHLLITVAGYRWNTPATTPFDLSWDQPVINDRPVLQPMAVNPGSLLITGFIEDSELTEWFPSTTSRSVPDGALYGDSERLAVALTVPTPAESSNPNESLFGDSTAMSLTSYGDLPQDSWVANQFHLRQATPIEITEIGILVPVGGSSIGVSGTVGLQFRTDPQVWGTEYLKALNVQKSFGPLAIGWNWIALDNPITWYPEQPYLMVAYQSGRFYNNNTDLSASAITSSGSSFELVPQSGTSGDPNRGWFIGSSVDQKWLGTSTRSYGIDIHAKLL